MYNKMPIVVNRPPVWVQDRVFQYLALRIAKKLSKCKIKLDMLVKIEYKIISNQFWTADLPFM